jgi:hypothetical protein
VRCRACPAFNVNDNDFTVGRSQYHYDRAPFRIIVPCQSDSYRIITGSNSQAAVNPSDGRLYRQGQVFMSGEEQQQKVTIGYSSGSKAWAAASAQIPDPVAWCQELAKKYGASAKSSPTVD